jgi:LacI family transcriptional regulator
MATLTQTGGTRPRPTMNDVAALSGVSLKTVSRVVNGEPTVSPDLVARVKRAAAQLNYRHNLTASSLRSGGRTKTIGLLLEDVSNPFSAMLHRAVEDVASQRGVAVLAASLNEDPDREQRLALALISRRVDGVIIVPATEDQSYLFDERRAGTAMVFVDRPPNLLDADCVLAENRRGAGEGVEHLVKHGHLRIAFLGDLRQIWTERERYLGYVETLQRCGVLLDPALVVHDLHSSEAAESAVGALLDRPDPPTAIFASQNLLTIGSIGALRARGLRHAVALVGYDDFVLADLLDPGVSVVAQNPTEMGRIAAETLFARIDGDNTKSRCVVTGTQLITRGSGEIRIGSG